MALRACGRLSVTVATLSATSTFRHSYFSYSDTFSSFVFASKRPRLCRRLMLALAADTRLHFRQSDMQRHRTRVLLQHPLNGFKMGSHQPRGRRDFSRAQHRQELSTLLDKPRHRNAARSRLGIDEAHVNLGY